MSVSLLEMQNYEIQPKRNEKCDNWTIRKWNFFVFVGDDEKRARQPMFSLSIVRLFRPLFSARDFRQKLIEFLFDARG